MDLHVVGSRPPLELTLGLRNGQRPEFVFQRSAQGEKQIDTPSLGHLAFLHGEDMVRQSLTVILSVCRWWRSTHYQSSKGP